MNTFRVNIEKNTDGGVIAYSTNDDEPYFIIGEGRSVAEAKNDFYNTMREFADIEKEESGCVTEILNSEPQFIIQDSELAREESTLSKIYDAIERSKR